MKIAGITTGLVLLFMVGIAQADLIVIGTATYNGSDYNLIWDDNNNGNSTIWLDYSNAPAYWQDQADWAAGLDLIYTIDESYSVTWIDAAWRLPNTVDGEWVYGEDGSTTAGFNITTSELGHLFYEELGNSGYRNTSGDVNDPYGLVNTGVFDNLIETAYWSGTRHLDAAANDSWAFNMIYGNQVTGIPYETCGENVGGGYALAIRSGSVITASTVPEPSTMLLFSTGLAGLAWCRRRRKNA